MLMATIGVAAAGAHCPIAAALLVTLTVIVAVALFPAASLALAPMV